MKGYKGFDKDMKCQGFQFKEGETFTHTGDVKLCASGFHFCENPLDVLSYYKIGDSKYYEVEADKVSDQKDNDSKRVCESLKIGLKLDIKAMVSAAIKFVFERVKATSGYSAHSATSGDYAHSAALGKNSIASAIGINCHVKGAVGNWIVCAEWVNSEDGWKVKGVESVKVDGKKIKADTWYYVKNGKFVEVKK